MYARVMRVDVDMQHLAELMQSVENGIVPSAQEQDGFEGMLGMVDQTTGHALLISLWKTPADLENTETSGYLQSQIARSMPFLKGPVFRETYRVVLQVDADRDAE